MEDDNITQEVKIKEKNLTSEQKEKVSLIIKKEVLTKKISDMLLDDDADRY
tara:strand:- start:297 stop:449 length:153 start_codon:yes stop_codon:yes gene_type:complete